MKTPVSYGYSAFGLNIKSFLHMPELREAVFSDSETDLIIGEATFPVPAGVEEHGIYFNDEEIIFSVPGTAVFKMFNGGEIFYTRDPDCSPDKIRLYLLGTCMGAILLQRGILPLHGSALIKNGKAFGIVGHSGAGKSTLASVLMKRGFQFITDDIMAVMMQGGHPIVQPAYPQQKLWYETLNQLGVDSLGLKPLFERETKFSVPVEKEYTHQPFPLTKIFEIVPVHRGSARLYDVSGLSKFPFIYEHTFRNSLLEKMNKLEWHFSYSADLAKKIKTYQITRPIGVYNAEELADLILTEIEMEEKIYENSQAT